MWLLTDENTDNEIIVLGVFDIPETAMNITSENSEYLSYNGGYYWELTPWGDWERQLSRYTKLVLRELPPINTIRQE